mmetsp:Transcript_6329/g.18180  ORF Transcript_6329/g.18180 Transcript_6329/m.18180 type:complete len:525 (-) Transcript_6329:251-1825(-)
MARQLAGPTAILNYLKQQSRGLEDILDACERIWPEWADNGCRMLNLQDGTPVRGPKKAEAAAALGVAAESALNLQSGRERMFKARDRRMLGLIEALRVQEARPPPGKYEYKGGWQQHDRPAEEDAQSSSTLSEAAAEREALLDSDTAVPSATAFSDTISAAAAAGATRDSSSNGSGSAVTSAPAQKGGAPHVTKLHPVAASEALLSLAAFGGPVFFQDEMEAIIQRVNLDKAEAWRPRRIADVVYALGLSHHWTSRLPELEALLVKCGGLAALTARESASIMWGLATLGHSPSALLAEVAERGWQFQFPYGSRKKGFRGVEALKPKQLSTLMWSLAAMEAVDSKPYADLWDEVARRGLSGMGTDAKMLMQFHQAALAAKLEGSQERYRRPDAAMARVLQVAEAHWTANIKPNRASRESLYEGQIAATLSSLGLFHLREDVTSGYAVDLSIPRDRVAIEADGPSHMARNDGSRVLGHTAMKRRHLAKLGWKVVQIPYFEWDELIGGGAQRRYVNERLEAVTAAAV